MTDHNSRATQFARKAILIRAHHSKISDEDVQESLDELKLLVEGLGIQVLQYVVQKRAEKPGASYLGEGKLMELAKLTGGSGIVERGPDANNTSNLKLRQDLSVFADDDLSPGQLRHLQLALGVEVKDRTAVILDVFESRAQTREAKLEIEMAKLEYELPRIRDDHSLGDKEGGGGRASRGHSNVELAKQRARQRIANLKAEIQKIQRIEASKQKQREEIFRVALVGYTNAGKSALMRALTGSEVFVENKLFATLGTTTRKVKPPMPSPVLVTDTVGFINRLPHQLIASFRSTLAEAKGASLLLHVIDCSNTQWKRQLELTQSVLVEIGLTSTPQWLILNKADKLTSEEIQERLAECHGGIAMSALNETDKKMLWSKIAETVQKT